KLPKRKRAWRYRSDRPTAGEPNEIWAMDFMTDQLFDGRSFRIDDRRLPHPRGALDSSENELPGVPGGRRSRSTGPLARQAAELAGRQWPGVRRSDARSMGLSKRRRN